jgi:hypothetical protein
MPHKAQMPASCERWKLLTVLAYRLGSGLLHAATELDQMSQVWRTRVGGSLSDQ